RRGRYGLIQEMDMVRGHVIGHPDGYGFLTTDGPSDDLYLSAREMRQVMHGDRVVAAISGIDSRGRKEGSIVEVLERRNQTVVGRYFLDNRIGIVVPEDKRISQAILVPDGEERDAHPGQIVVVKIVEPPTRRRQPVGHVIELLGDHMAPGMEVEVALRKHQIPHSWPDDVHGETTVFAKVVESRAKRGREDLRDLPLVTIDGEDARDFDDAVYCTRSENGWRLIVAIADVAHYVRPGTALDCEAQTRGNSVYFPDRVVPMLPEELSNTLCSLKPGAPRPCLAMHLWIDRAGQISRHRLVRGLMRSAARLTYEQVQAARDGHPDAATAPLIETVIAPLYGVFDALLQAREKRGTIDLDLPERQIVLDADGHVAEIKPRTRLMSHRLIEEFMIAANVAAAETLAAPNRGGLFRVHDSPPPDKLDELREFLATLDIRINKGEAMWFLAIDAETEGLAMAGAPLQRRTGRETIGRPISESELADIREEIGKSDPKLAQFVKDVKEIADQDTDRLFATFFDLTGREPIRVIDYFRRRRNLEATTKAGLPTTFREVVIQYNENLGFGKDREGGTRAPIIIEDFLTVMLNHIQETSKVIHIAPGIRDAAGVLLDIRVVAAINATRGEGMNRDLQVHLGAASLARTKNDGIARFVRFVNGSAAIAKLGLNETSQLRQLGGLSRLVPILGPRRMKEGLASVFQKGLMREMTENSGFFWERYIGNISGRHSAVEEGIDFGVDRAKLLDFYDRFSENVSKGDILGAMQAARDASMSTLQILNMLDSVNARVAWIGYRAEVQRNHPD
ncbi:MAG: VacB/RNase II family 3'-5' exoribonuclease, partial [Planctomycetes bacterium]|nr:VacB/RNase II family 3'-5' exoribonuclease [Planctomycetota bacterium]